MHNGKHIMSSQTTPHVHNHTKSVGRRCIEGISTPCACVWCTLVAMATDKPQKWQITYTKVMHNGKHIMSSQTTPHVHNHTKSVGRRCIEGISTPCACVWCTLVAMHNAKRTELWRLHNIRSNKRDFTSKPTACFSLQKQKSSGFSSLFRLPSRRYFFSFNFCKRKQPLNRPEIFGIFKRVRGQSLVCTIFCTKCTSLC